ncbi:LicD family protein [Oribacterium asaccharolyticum]|uniref:LicD family protein n=1 Tax=Oribacterium asaccharolyticum TaxID=1501332 RepID=UPI0028E2FB9B|nr:LicD family protein [Oribacterium asaccharolyticum]
MNLAADFFYDEVRDGFYIPGMMKRAWGAELSVLKEIDKICKKHRIPYFLSSGTLLGAVREGGQFIPWDDDVDIEMFRKDYMKFLRVAKEELPEELYIRAIEVNIETASFVPKVGLREDVMSLPTLEKYCFFPYKVEIDIFLLDELSDKEEEELYREEVLTMLYSLNDMVFEGTSREDVELLLEKIEEALHFHFDRNLSLNLQIKSLINRFFQEFNETEGHNIAIFPYYHLLGNCRFPRKAYENTILLPFCGMRFPAAEGYEMRLDSEYGDWHKKSKSGEDHNYPCYKESEEHVSRILPAKAFPRYSFQKESMERNLVRSLRKQYLGILDGFFLEERRGTELLQKGEYAAYQSLLAALQEGAIAFGELLGEKIGKDAESISLLESYCEMLYQRYQNASSPEEKKKEIMQEEETVSLLKALKERVGKELKVQAVFLLHRAKDFAGLRPLVDALRKENVDCKIIPIPYYDKAVNGAFREVHYEGGEFPKEYAITDYKSYDFEKELPDCIVMNSPYDEYNPVFSIESAFYSRNLKRFTGKLIYIPWFVTDEIDPENPEDGKAFYNMRYYVTVPGVFHADYTIVQSEGMKKAYLVKILQFLEEEEKLHGTLGIEGADESGKKSIDEVLVIMLKKILGAGSCLLGEKEGQGTKEVVSCFLRLLSQ